MEINNVVELPVAEWRVALQGLSKVVRRKASLPVLEYLKIRRDANGQVTVAGTDLESFVIYRPKSLQTGPATEFLIPMAAMVQAAKSSEGRIGLVHNEPLQVIIRTHLAGQQIEQSVESVAVKEWPVIPQIEASGSKLGGQFLATLQQAFECAGDESARPVLQSAYLDRSDPQAHYLVASNGRLMYAANSFTFDLPTSLIIPNRKFLNWKELVDGTVEIAAQSLAREKETVAWVRLQTGPWEFITQGIEGPFPNWRQVAPTEGFKTRIRLNTVNLKVMLEVAPKLPGSEESNQPIRLAVKDGCLHLAGQPKNGGGTAAIPLASAVVEGESVGVSLNRQHLLKALRFGLNEIKIVDELSPVVFANATGKRLVVSPIRPV